ncbi:MAG: heavy-metal-associated domain-containing protein [Nitriliruptoraceae bacterium]|nr:heavy-metal-associated domain-containing protein [Nitriliruptoraceae bacterium]
MTSTLTVRTPDATCGNCQAHITEAAEALDGVTAVTVDLDTKHTVVTFDADRVEVAAIEAALTDAGYPPHPVEG